MTVLLLMAVAFLAYANGANDNVKGVATLLGSGRFDERTAMRWAAVTTMAGAVLSLWVGSGLAATFSGKGIVPQGTMSAEVLGCVAIAAAATVALATRFGFPVSTTHALVGALVGVALAVDAGEVQWTVLSRLLLLPLVLAPVLAIPSAALAERVTRRLEMSRAAESETPCVCALPAAEVVSAGGPAAPIVSGAELRAGTLGSCGPMAVVLLTPSRVRDAADLLISGMVGFARGMNDAPKIAALAMAGFGARSGGTGVALVAAGMALGGLLHGRRVGDTMGRRVVPLTPRPALCANVATAALVLTASFASLPVSTTHVSCGSIVGVGLRARRVRRGVVSGIAAAWLITVPVAAALAAAALALARWA